MKILIVGNPGPTHVGGHFINAAKHLGHSVSQMDMVEAYAGPKLLKSIYWHLLGRRPMKLHQFSRAAAAFCDSHKPHLVLTTGLAPLSAPAIDSMKRSGATVVNYSTDDPWNPAHKARWFLDALPAYDLVLSTRRANLEEFREAGVKRAEWLPFGYAPDMHFPLEHGPVTDHDADVAFYGNVDADRIPLLEHLVQAGLKLALHTANRVPPSLRPSWRGYADAAAMRHLMAHSAVALIIGRKANRDGHAMRSYEVPAMRGCPIVEDTPEHREMYGAEGDAVLYFSTPDELVIKIRRLLKAGFETRQKMRHAAWERITTNKNTYADRLSEIILYCTV